MEPKPMEPSREAFEKWISAPPFERASARWSSEESAWPGTYADYDVQLAWEAWQQRSSSLRSEYEDVLVDRNKILADFQRVRSELQAAQAEIERLKGENQCQKLASS